MLHVNFLQYYFNHHSLEENKNWYKMPFQPWCSKSTKIIENIKMQIIKGRESS